MPDAEMTPDPPPPRSAERRTPFEWSLAALRPADSGAERPSFMFKAGQASRDTEVRFWRWAAVGCGLLLAAGAGAGGWLIADATRRAEVAEARAAANSPHPAEKRDEGAPWSSTSPLVGEVGETESSRVGGQVHNPPPADSSGVDDLPHKGGGVQNVASPPAPTPRDIAAALQLRRDILVAGLGVIPDGKPPIPTAPSSPGEWDRHWATPSGVLTTPKISPKKPTPIADPDDE